MLQNLLRMQNLPRLLGAAVQGSGSDSDVSPSTAAAGPAPAVAVGAEGVEAEPHLGERGNPVALRAVAVAVVADAAAPARAAPES
jgi:hypothetical protein